MTAELRAEGHDPQPVSVRGRKIASTFWGESWCKNLEAYSDYENRLPRGRTYVRNGSVIDLSITAGTVSALVCGSDVYEIQIAIKPLETEKWKKIRSLCAGRIDSVVELLRGSISAGVMDIVTRKGKGLFPSPSEISLDCSCPDWATMCKHVAAALYGVGARLDEKPELLFELRGVDPAELIAEAATAAGRRRAPAKSRALAESDVASVFGIEIDMGDAAAPRRPRKKAAAKKPAKKTARKATKKSVKKSPKKTTKKAAKKAAKKSAKKVRSAKAR